MIRGALASRYGISPLGRGVIRPASGGWWLSGGIAAANCIMAYQPKGAADYATSKINLANPGTYNCSDGTAHPTWSAADGWIFNAASSQYLNTGWQPGVNRDYSYIIRFTGFSNSYGYLFGASNGYGIGTAIFFRNDINKSYFANFRAETDSGDSYTGTAYTLAISDRECYSEGVNVLTLDAPYTGAVGTIANDVFIGCVNSNGTPDKFMSGNIVAYSVYDVPITPEQVVAVTTAMNAL